LRTKVYYFTLSSLIKGHTTAEMERINAVVGPELLQRIKPGSLERIREHQQAGRPVVVVSAGAHEMVEAFAKVLGAVSGEGTRLEHKDGIYTGGGDEVCQGEGKARRVRQVAAERGYDLTQSYGYGDTLSDVTFLELLGHPAVIDPEPELVIVARQRGWTVIQSNEPAKQVV
jgi:HAD superfamily hydrolase (TIGR01490 family)